MRHYETILSKITPTLYKLIQYEEYFDSECRSENEYIEKAKGFGFCGLYFPMQNIYYHFFSYIPPYTFAKRRSRLIKGYQTIIFNTKDKLEERFYNSSISLCELIVDLVINNFKFEDEHPTVPDLSISLKDLFIALVGRDMYDTIRANIR